MTILDCKFYWSGKIASFNLLQYKKVFIWLRYSVTIRFNKIYWVNIKTLSCIISFNIKILKKVSAFSRLVQKMSYWPIIIINHIKSRSSITFWIASSRIIFFVSTFGMWLFLTEYSFEGSLLLLRLLWFKQTSNKIDLSVSSLVWDSRLSIISNNFSLWNIKSNNLFTLYQL